MMKGLAKGMMKFDINVTETNETKKIGKWNCRKYIAEVKTTEELLEYEEKSAPAGTYEIPKGYKKTKGFMED